MPTKEEWVRAFAKQARADFDAWNTLQLHLRLPQGVPLVPRCQNVHFLQMAFEKLAKAHLIKQAAVRVRQQCKRIAREIELLSPSVNDGGRRADNCEYPWEHGGVLYIPAEWPFANLDLLTEAGGRNILKRVREAIERLTC